MPKITHIITSLDPHGAQRMLLKLLRHMDRSVWSSEVISLSDVGNVGINLQAEGIAVNALNMRRGASALLGVPRLVQMLRRSKPDIVQTWLYHADLVGSLAASFAGASHVVWNVRHSSLEERGIKRSMRLIARLCGVLSRWVPDHIVCNSIAGMHYHCDRFGYRRSLFKIIPNGFELDRYRKRPDAKIQLCKQLGISQESLIVGMAARFHPQKDHKTFVRAAAKIGSHVPNVRFVLCGENIDHNNGILVGWLKDSKMLDSFHLMGPRSDIPDITSGFDVAVSSSAFGEGFPNIVGEAMSCEVPCVVTDVGDSAWIIGESGRVVAPGDASALADACEEFLSLSRSRRHELGKDGRSRVEKYFSIDEIVKQYENLYISVMGARYEQI